MMVHLGPLDSLREFIPVRRCAPACIVAGLAGTLRNITCLVGYEDQLLLASRAKDSEPPVDQFRLLQYLLIVLYRDIVEI